MAVWICLSTALGSEDNCEEVVFCSTPDTADSICVRKFVRLVAPLLDPLPAVDEDEFAAVELPVPLGFPAPPSASKAIRLRALAELLALVLLV